jgi:hypothetical protein
MDQERLKKKAADPIEDDEEGNPLLREANRRLQMEHDRVKAMLSLVKKAEALAGREAQIVEKAEEKKREKKEEAYWHKVRGGVGEDGEERMVHWTGKRTQNTTILSLSLCVFSVCVRVLV